MTDIKFAEEDAISGKRLFQDFSRFCKRSQSLTEHERRHHGKPTERKFRSISCEPLHCRYQLEKKEPEKRKSRTSFVLRAEETSLIGAATHVTVDEDDDENEQAVATSPQGRFLKFSCEIGRGAFKTVFKGLDTETGVAVAWCEIQEKKWRKSETQRFHEEAEILKSLHHANIVRFFDYFIDPKNKLIVLVTELMTSGTLRTYIKRFKKINMKLMKNWSRQILKGLNYLHGQSPPVIHRDLKCDNIFITGASGLVKIGDLGLATLKKRSFAKSVIGTPEFMAPEMYEEKYDESVDVYAFGMCLLEMATSEYPYKECASAAAIYRKVINGIKPESFKLVENQELRNIISGCIRPDTKERFSVQQLLRLEFFADELAVKVDLVPADQQPADMSVIKFQLRVVDNKKKRLKLGENEAIQFAYHAKTDKPDSIVSELVSSKLIDEGDKLLVTKRIEMLAKKEVIRRDDEKKKSEEQAKQAAEQQAQLHQQMIQQQQQQQNQPQQQPSLTDPQPPTDNQGSSQQPPQQLPQHSESHSRSTSQGFIPPPPFVHGASMPGMDIHHPANPASYYWQTHPHGSMTNIAALHDMQMPTIPNTLGSAAYIAPQTAHHQVVFLPPNHSGYYYGQSVPPVFGHQGFHDYHSYAQHNLSQHQIVNQTGSSGNSTPAGSCVNLYQASNEERRSSGPHVLPGSEPESTPLDQNTRSSLPPGNPKAAGLPPKPGRRMSSQAVLGSGGATGVVKVPRTPSAHGSRTNIETSTNTENRMPYDPVPLSASNVHPLIVGCCEFEADSDSESLSECTMTEQEVEQYKRYNMRVNGAGGKCNRAIGVVGQGQHHHHHRMKRVQTVPPLEIEVVDSSDEFVTCKLVQEGDTSYVRSVTLKVYPVSANAEEIARELIKMRYLSKSSRPLFLQKLEGIIEKFKDHHQPDGDSIGHSDDAIGEVAMSDATSSGICVAESLTETAGSECGSCLSGRSANLLTVATGTSSEGSVSTESTSSPSSQPAGCSPQNAETVTPVGTPNSHSLGAPSGAGRNPMSPGASSTGSGGRTGLSRPSFELINIEQHKASSIPRGQLSRHHRPAVADVTETTSTSASTSTQSRSNLIERTNSSDASTQTATGVKDVVLVGGNKPSAVVEVVEKPIGKQQHDQSDQVDIPAPKGSSNETQLSEKKPKGRILIEEPSLATIQEPPTPTHQVSGFPPPTTTTTGGPNPLSNMPPGHYSSSSSLSGTPSSSMTAPMHAQALPLVPPGYFPPPAYGAYHHPSYGSHPHSYGTHPPPTLMNLFGQWCAVYPLPNLPYVGNQPHAPPTAPFAHPMFPPPVPQAVDPVASVMSATTGYPPYGLPSNIPMPQPPQQPQPPPSSSSLHHEGNTSSPIHAGSRNSSVDLTAAGIHPAIQHRLSGLPVNRPHLQVQAQMSAPHGLTSGNLSHSRTVPDFAQSARIPTGQTAPSNTARSGPYVSQQPPSTSITTAAPSTGSSSSVQQPPFLVQQVNQTHHPSAASNVSHQAPQQAQLPGQQQSAVSLLPAALPSSQSQQSVVAVQHNPTGNVQLVQSQQQISKQGSSNKNQQQQQQQPSQQPQASQKQLQIQQPQQQLQQQQQQASQSQQQNATSQSNQPAHNITQLQTTTPVIVATGDGPPSGSTSSKVSRESSPKVAQLSDEHPAPPSQVARALNDDIDSLDSLDKALRENLFPEKPRPPSPSKNSTAATPVSTTAPRGVTSSQTSITQSAPQISHKTGSEAAKPAQVPPLTSSTSSIFGLSTPLNLAQNSASAQQVAVTEASSVTSPVTAAAATSSTFTGVKKVIFEIGSKGLESDHFAAPVSAAIPLSINNGGESDTSVKHSSKTSGRKIFRVNQVKDDPLKSVPVSVHSDANPSSDESSCDHSVRQEVLETPKAAKQITQPESVSTSSQPTGASQTVSSQQ